MRHRLAVPAVLIVVLCSCGRAPPVVTVEFERIPCPPVAPQLREACLPFAIPDPRGRPLRQIGKDIEDGRVPHAACYDEVVLWREGWNKCVRAAAQEPD